MRIGVNALEMKSAASHSKAGLSRYAWNLIDALLELKPAHEFTFYVNQQFEVPSGWRGRPGFTFVSTKGKIGRMPHLWGGIASIPLSLKYDAWLSLANTLPVRSRAKRILVVHDLFPVTHPELYVERRAKIMAGSLRRSVRSADRLIAVSEATKKELNEVLGVPLDKVSVTPLGPGNEIARVERESVSPADLKRIGIPWPRFLFTLSTIEPRKNLPRLLQAFAKIAHEDRFADLGLAIGGGKGWEGSDLAGLAKSLAIEERIKFLGYVKDEDLPILFASCEAFILASLTEGFGIPVLEAMLGGAPVVCSRSGALPEVGGDAVLYFDPTDADDIASKIMERLDSKQPRAEVVQRGLARAAQFDWESAARQTIAVVEEACRQ